MNQERPELRLVREKLESVLAPPLAQSALFEALAEAGGKPPSTRESIVALVEGPLRKALRRRLLADELDPVIAEIVDTVSRVFPSGGTPPKGRPRELEPTLQITRGKGAVGVLVFAGSEELAARLEVALGPDRVTPRTCTSRVEVEPMLQSGAPAILLVDATDFPPIEPVELAELLARSPRGTVCAIWGADLGYGSVVLGELVQRHADATPLDRREGIDPLLDIVRSRGA